MLWNRATGILVVLAFAGLAALLSVGSLDATPSVHDSRGDEGVASSVHSYQSPGAVGADPAGMIWIAGGAVLVGSNVHYVEEGPQEWLDVEGFWIDRHEVTNREFRAFVEATGYRTMAERPGPEGHAPGSAVFGPDADGRWGWRFVEGANWRAPRGPGSDIDGLDHHPVVQVSLRDAAAYAGWRGRRLPTETEWEHAARPSSRVTEFAWGDELAPNGLHMANTWQGEFPSHNDASDGYAATAPVESFPPNEFGIYDLIGNVWEWTQTAYSVRRSEGDALERGGLDPRQPGVSVGVLKGGSYLCAPEACRRYRPAARHPQEVDLGTNHIGFRTVLDGPPTGKRVEGEAPR